MLRNVAMATNFWLSMGYNFGCIIASDTLFDSRGWIFGVKLSDKDIVEIECLTVVAMATNFGTKIAILVLCERQRLGNWLWRGFEWSANKMQLCRYTATIRTLP